MHPLVYIPGDRSDCLQRVGLDALLDGAAYTSCPKGPDGRGGQLVSWSTPHRPVKPIYRPAEQEWVPAVPLNGRPAARYHVGFWNASPVKPVDLLRPDAKRGASVRLGDGELWEVPRAWDLPFDLVRGDSGLYERVVQRRFTEFFVGVGHWRVKFEEAKEGDSFLWADLADFVELALSINYRITPEIINHLRLFQQGVGESLLRAGMAIVSIGELGGN